MEKCVDDVISLFGLTMEQSILMFSTQKMIAEYDCKLSEGKKDFDTKKNWIDEWEKGINLYLDNLNKQNVELYTAEELSEAFKKEFEQSANKAWYYIVLLECLTFTPYTLLGDSEKDKQYKKCKYNEKKTNEFVKDYFENQGYISKDKIERIEKTYEKSINQISGKTTKLITKIVTVVAVAAVAAALAAVLAGPIAVAVFGSTFEGLSGAALTSACLALAGGGAIAAGGLGMAGGVAIIAGGGALLGIAGGGAAVGITAKMLLSSPDYTLTQAAKLETVLKEVIVNAQKDILTAQKVLEQYKEQIYELNNKIADLELSDKKNKAEIKNMQLSLKYIKKSYQNMSIFTSAYEEGLKVQNNA